MCRTCNGRFNVRERLAHHDFMEQMLEWQGIPGKYLKKRNSKNLKKSLVSKIEHHLYKLQIEHEPKYWPKLQSLLSEIKEKDLNSVKNSFEEIMISYYKDKIKAE